jgi:hypothetical protein
MKFRWATLPELRDRNVGANGIRQQKGWNPMGRPVLLDLKIFSAYDILVETLPGHCSADTRVSCVETHLDVLLCALP